MSRDWLNHIPAEHRGVVCNHFYSAARSGYSDPRKVCSQVFRGVAEALEFEYPSTPKPLLRTIMAALKQDPDGAVALAEWVLHQEDLPPEERAKAKAAETERGKCEVMESKPATAAQQKALAKLGYTGEIKNRQHASDLINQLKTW